MSNLKKGKSIALVSDAGTPIINDPGYYLVCCCREEDINIVPLPGACAAITALSVAGLPSNRFCYEGFLPTTRKKRLSFLESLKEESRTIIFYESTHRILDSMQDMVTIWGPNRYIVIARELTKTWESIIGAQVGKLLFWIKDDKIRSKGEIVLIVKGYEKNNNIELLSPEVLSTLKRLKYELPIKKAIAITAEIYNLKKNFIYSYILKNYDNT